MNIEEYKQLSEEEEKQFYKELSEKLERNEDFINAVQKTFDKYISKKCLIELNKWQQLNENMKNKDVFLRKMLRKKKVFLTSPKCG